MDRVRRQLRFSAVLFAAMRLLCLSEDHLRTKADYALVRLRINIYDDVEPQ